MQKHFKYLSPLVFTSLLLFIINPALALLPQVPGSSITATADSEFLPPYTVASLTIDSSGMTGDLHDNHASGHTMWLSSQNGAGNAGNNPAGISGPAWLLYTFSGVTQLDEMWVWNHNQENLTDRGLRNVSIHYSENGTDWTLLTQTELTRAPGTDNYAHVDEIDFGLINAKFVLITAADVNGNYGSDYYGMSEIRFYGDTPPCVPEDYPVQIVSVEVDPVYDTMLVPQTVGWLGSDVGHSTPINASESVWLFGDTLIGTSSNGKRDGGASFINSSIAIQDRVTSSGTNVQFYWGAGNTSFFPHVPGTPGDIYWSTQSVMLGSELFVFCYSVVFGGGGLGFSLENSVLIRIPNPQDPPASWTQNVFDLGTDNNVMGFHSALYLDPPYLYMMGYDGFGNMVLARAATADLMAGGLSEVFEYWNDAGVGSEWTTSTLNLTPLFSPSVTETDIQYEPDWDLFFVTTYNAFTGEVFLTTAKEITGPWSAPVCLYNIPEFDEISFNIIGYAVRPHPELSTQPGELIISYVTNSLDGIAPLFTEEGFGVYHPRFIRVQLKLNEPPAGIDGFWIH